MTYPISIIDRYLIYVIDEYSRDFQFKRFVHAYIII